VTFRIRVIPPGDDAGLASFVDVVNTVTPDWPTSLDDIAWEDRTYPGIVRVLAMLDGTGGSSGPGGSGGSRIGATGRAGDEVVGAASVGRIFMYAADHPRLWAGIRVLPRARRRGIGSALWVELSQAARMAGKTGLEGLVSEAEADAVAFCVHRGFEIVERSKMVRLDLRGLAVPIVDVPRGILLTTLAERPDLEAALHAVALESYPDIPSADEPVEVGPLDEFIARDVRRDGIPPDAFAIALDAPSGLVVGWASLMRAPGSTTMAWHDMTAVRPAWRGRGIATALKRATIAWAVTHGLETLDTGNDEDNGPMRAVNARLGYRPQPDMLTVRGPLAPEPAGAPADPDPGDKEALP
jgi:mycothiol synthase